jgi:tetratricopeptide (TPR) repeat protein
LGFCEKLRLVFVGKQARGWRFGCASGLLVLSMASAPSRLIAQSSDLATISNLIRQEKLPEAERRLQSYLKIHPHSAKATSLLGTLYLRQGKIQLAEKALQKAVADSPASLDARIGLGDVYSVQGKFDNAVGEYQAAAKISPQDPRANLALAKLYLGAGEFAKSLDAAQKIPPDKRTAELLPTLAADYFGLQQPEKAGVEIQALLQVAEKQPDLIPELCEFFLARRDFRSSEKLLSLAKDKQPPTDRFLVDLAQTQAGLGQLDDAQTTLEGILARRPDSVDALVAAGKVASQQLNWEAAAEAFSRADSLAPDRPDILYGLATAQLRTNSTEAALKNAEKLHELVPDDLRSTYVLALALFGAKKWEDAKPYTEQVVKAHPEDREMNLVLTDIALNDEHNLPAARSHVNVILKQNSNDSAALYYLGMIQKMDGDVNGAILNLSKSVAGNPKSADAQGALGSLCLQAGDLTKAIPALEQAALLAPDEAQNHYQLALAYSRAGVSDKAKAQLEIYQQMKAKEVKDAKNYKGPSTSEVPSMGIGSKP